MHHMDPKKYPKKPALLWDEKADDQSPEAMLEIAFAMAANGKEFKKQYLADKEKKKMN